MNQQSTLCVVPPIFQPLSSSSAVAVPVHVPVGGFAGRRDQDSGVCFPGDAYRKHLPLLHYLITHETYCEYSGWSLTNMARS